MPAPSLDADAVARTTGLLWRRVEQRFPGSGLAGTAVSLRTPTRPVEIFQFIHVLESGINDVVLVGAAVFFLLTAEKRLKRSRALAAVNEIENLTTGLAGKIWQKLMIVYATRPGAPAHDRATP